jgi:hypothetical protein
LIVNETSLSLSRRHMLEPERPEAV